MSRSFCASAPKNRAAKRRDGWSGAVPSQSGGRAGGNGALCAVRRAVRRAEPQVSPPTARRRRRAEVTLCAPSEGPHGEAAAGKRDGIYALASRRGRHPVCRLGTPVWRRSPHQTYNSPPPRGGAGGRWRVLSGGALPRRVGWRKAQKRGCPSDLAVFGGSPGQVAKAACLRISRRGSGRSRDRRCCQRCRRRSRCRCRPLPDPARQQGAGRW